MADKSSRNYVCLNKNDEKFLEETYLEDLLDTQGRTNAPLRTENVRKSIEHHLERQRLKKNIADFESLDDFDLLDEYEEH